MPLHFEDPARDLAVLHRFRVVLGADRLVPERKRAEQLLPHPPVVRGLDGGDVFSSLSRME
jgi:hypothetical protein